MTQPLPFIRDIEQGTVVSTLLRISEATLKQAQSGPFWFLKLEDVTGSLEAIIWDPLSREFANLSVSSLVEVEGSVGQFRGKKQLTIAKMRVLGEDEVSSMDISRFVESSKIPPLEMLEELKELCQSELHYEPWIAVAKILFEDNEIKGRMLKAPAARFIHHAYPGGLLEHTLSVAKLCMSLADRYPFLDRQILLVAAVFHDFGKLWEFTAGISSDYSDEGRLVGHIALGVEHLSESLVQAAVPEPLRVHLKHMILSHHGQLEYGSPILPQTAEALVLHYADNIDARLAQYRTLIEKLPEESSWTSYQNKLNRQFFCPQKTAFFASEGLAEEDSLEPFESSSYNSQCAQSGGKKQEEYTASEEASLLEESDESPVDTADASFDEERKLAVQDQKNSPAKAERMQMAVKDYQGSLLK